MTAIIPNLLFPHLTAEEAYDLVNSLPVSFQDFAEISKLYHRLYGVLTGANRGYNPASASTVMNNCLRNAVWNSLAAAAADAELYTGFSLSERYHVDEFPCPHNGTYQTRWPGLSAINVKPEWSEIDGYGPFPIDVYNETGVSVVAGPPIIATFGSTLNPNPNDVYVRNTANNGAYILDPTQGYPKRSGTDWEVAIDARIGGWTPGDAVGIQNRLFVYLDVAPPVSQPDGSTLYPVYPGTTQIIPEARPRQTVGGLTRYTFFLHTLIDPAFLDEDPVADLVAGEFYKVLSEIEIKALAPVAATPEVYWRVGDQQVQLTGDDLPNATILAERDGLVQFTRIEYILSQIGDTWPNDDDPDAPARVTFKFYYQTNPRYLDPKYSRQIPAIRQAMLYKVAAMLPASDCGCEIDDTSFIGQQQAMLPDSMITAMGTEIQSYGYKDRMGLLRYENDMQKVLRYQRLFTL